MSYTPTDWKTGDVITAEKLNNIEGGLSRQNMVIPIQFDEDNGVSYITKASVLAVAEAGPTVIDFGNAGEYFAAIKMSAIVDSGTVYLRYATLEGAGSLNVPGVVRPVIDVEGDQLVLYNNLAYDDTQTPPEPYFPQVEFTYNQQKERWESSEW